MRPHPPSQLKRLAGSSSEPLTREIIAASRTIPSGLSLSRLSRLGETLGQMTETRQQKEHTVSIRPR